MLKNYIKIALRNLNKNKASSFINIFGLSIALGCSIVVYLFVHSNLTKNGFHEHGAQIFLVEPLADREGNRETWGYSPIPMGPALEADLSQVVRSVRIERSGGYVQSGSIALDEGIIFVDPGFFDMFTFPLKYGNADALNDPDAVFMGEETAMKYFGEENPIGQQITITRNEQVESFTVQGVAEAFPANAGFSFSLLMNFNNQLKLGTGRLDDWSTFTSATFIQVKNPDDIKTITAQMNRYVSLANVADKDWKIVAYTVDNLFDLVYNARNVNGMISGGIPWAPIIVLSSIATFLLLLSCFNYMNIALAAAGRRLKEIGVRKVMGSTRQQLVSQFLAENILLCLLSLLLSISVAQTLLVPGFNEITGGNLTLVFSKNIDLWVFLITLLVGIGLASGAYPAFYISSFQPVTIFTGKQRIGGRNRFMQVLLTMQFVLAFITMIASVTFILNGRYLGELDWGYDHEDTIYIRLYDSNRYSVLKNEALQLPDVLSVTGSRHHLGESEGRESAIIDGESVSIVYFDVGPNYFETVGLRLKTGQFINDSEAVVINEVFARTRGWTESLGQTIRFEDTVYTVVGVVEDFHYRDFEDPIMPALFRLGDESEFQYLTLRVNTGAGVESALALKNTWERLVPGTPFEYFFQNEVFEQFFQESGGITRVFTFVAIIALLISCLGLFGLASQNIASRLKEISIRKVLGASVPHITLMANRRFLLLLSIGAVVATPLSYLIMNTLLDDIYTYRMSIGPSSFIFAYVLVFITASLTIATQVYKLISTNPVEVLRNE